MGAQAFFELYNLWFITFINDANILSRIKAF